MPESYSITLTDPYDLFFHFTSIRITPERFRQLTMNIDMVVSTVKHKSTISRSFGGFRPMIRNTTKNEVPFHDELGIGGVIGVFGNDYMDGVNREPERFH